MSATYRKTRPQTSVVWNHFTKMSDGRAECTKCKATYAKSSSNSTLRFHLEGTHGIKFGKESSQPSSSLVIQQPNQQQQQGTLVNMFSIAKRRRLTKTEDKAIDDALVQLIFEDMRPFAIVDGSGFKNFCSKMNPDYDLKSRNTYRSKAVSAHALAVTKLKSILARASDLSITTDLWTSNKQEAYISITAHWLDDELKMQHAILATPEMPEAHTGVNIASRIKQVLRDFNIENKVIAYVADNGSNVVKALNELDAPGLGCFAHTLQLSVKLGLKVRRVSDMRTSAKHLVRRFKKSSKAATALRERQTGEGVTAYRLIMEVETRWNSTCCMFTRLLRLEWSVRSVLSDSTVISRQDAAHLEMKQEHWDLMRELLPLLEPLKEMTDILQGQGYPTISLVYPALHIIKQELERNVTTTSDENKNAISAFKTAILEKLCTSYYATGHETSLPMLASALDPRFKHMHFVGNGDVRQNIYREVKAKILGWTMARQPQHNTSDVVGTSTSTVECVDVDMPSTSLGTPSSAATSASATRKKVYDLFSGLTKARTTGSCSNSNNNSNNANTYEKLKAEVGNQFECFLDEPIVGDFNEDPLGWWRNKLHRYPALEIGVRTLFCIPATSAPVERVFSSAGNIVDTKRASLLPQNVDMLLFMYTNKHLWK